MRLAQHQYPRDIGISPSFIAALKEHLISFVDEHIWCKYLDIFIKNDHYSASAVYAECRFSALDLLVSSADRMLQTTGGPLKYLLANLYRVRKAPQYMLYLHSAVEHRVLRPLLMRL